MIGGNLILLLLRSDDIRARLCQLLHWESPIRRKTFRFLHWERPSNWGKPIKSGRWQLTWQASPGTFEENQREINTTFYERSMGWEGVPGQELKFQRAGDVLAAFLPEQTLVSWPPAGRLESALVNVCELEREGGRQKYVSNNPNCRGQWSKTNFCIRKKRLFFYLFC